MTRISRTLCVIIFAAMMSVFLGTIQIARAQSRFATVNLQAAANNQLAWLPINEAGVKLLGGVPFDLLSSSGKNVWDSAIGTVPGVRSTQTLVLPVNIYGAAKVYTLINTSCGVLGSSTVSLSFVCSDGVKHTVALKSGESIRDWHVNGYVSTVNERMTQNMMPDWPKGEIDRQQIALPKTFAERTLTQIVLTDAGVTGKDPDPDRFNLRVRAQRAFLLGLTVEATNDGPTQAPSTDSSHSDLSFDDLTQKLLDETISKLKGAQAKQVSELKQKYKRDSEKLAQQRTELGDEMQGDVLKAMVLPRGKTIEANQGESNMLKAIDSALDKASKEPESTLAKSQCKKEILAAVDKNNAWDEETKTRQYEIINAAPDEKRKRLVSVYIVYESKFTAQMEREAAHVAQYKKDLLEIVAPEGH